MRKFILSSLAAVVLAGSGAAAAAVGEGSVGVNVHAEGVSTMLGGKAAHVQVADVQAIFNSASLGGARFSSPVTSNAGDFQASGSMIGDFLPAEGGSSSAILLAGALVVVAVVLRRLS